MFLKIGVLKNFANLIGKATPTQVFSCEICERFKNIFFYRAPLVAASEQIQEISMVHCVAK